MYLIVRLFGDRENQKRFHHDLREPLLKLFNNGTIRRFVLTYHYKGKDMSIEIYENFSDRR